MKTPKANRIILLFLGAVFGIVLLVNELSRMKQIPVQNLVDSFISEIMSNRHNSADKLMDFFKGNHYKIEQIELIGKPAWMDLNENVVLDEFALKKNRIEILVFDSASALAKERYLVPPSKKIEVSEERNGLKVVFVQGKDVWEPQQHERIKGGDDELVIVIFSRTAIYVARHSEARLTVYNRRWSNQS